MLILGGSQGAHAINVAMVAAAPELARRAAGLELVHQTGERDLASVRDGYAARRRRRARGSLSRPVAGEMTAADLVICRAGATTLAELAAAGRPAVLVPFPAATDDHQRKNAQVLADAGAAVLIDERDLTAGRAGATSPATAGRRGTARRRWRARCATFARPDAAARIVDRVLALAGWRGTARRRDGMWLGRTRRVHFVGVGGIGMSGIAELLANLGLRGERIRRAAIGHDRSAGVAGRAHRDRP